MQKLFGWIGVASLVMLAAASGCQKPLTEKEEAEVKDMNIEVDVGEGGAASAGAKATQ